MTTGTAPLGELDSTSGRQRPAPALLRDHLIALLGCSHFELGRLLREKIAPLPVRLDGLILWYEDEAREAIARCQDATNYWRKRRAQSQRAPA
jgi:predicted DNA-binding transcriptional regulator AlpA